mgnify:CR=1 FL=1
MTGNAGTPDPNGSGVPWFSGETAGTQPKQAAISRMRAVWTTPKGQRRSQWPHWTQSSAWRSSRYAGARPCFWRSIPRPFHSPMRRARCSAAAICRSRGSAWAKNFWNAAQ